QDGPTARIGAPHTPSAWGLRVLIPTRATGSRRIPLIDFVQRDSNPCRFLSHIPHHLAVRPLADFLVGLRAEVDAILNVAHIAHREMAYSLLLGKGHDHPRRFMQEVALLAIAAGRGLRLPP